MTRYAYALALVAALALPDLVRASPMPELETAPRAEGALSYERITFENDAFVLAIALYWEGGSTGESVEGMRRIADVIKTRAQANRPDFGGRKLYNVVFHSHATKKGSVCQFSFACLPQTKRNPIQGARWTLANEVARDALLDDDRPEPDEVAEYYLNPEFSSLRSMCWFKSNLVQAGQTGRHFFWREPKRWDPPIDASVKPDECVRYAAQLELEKLKAKRSKFAKLKTKKKVRYAAVSKKRKRYARS